MVDNTEQPLDPDLQNLMNELGQAEGEVKPQEPKIEEKPSAKIEDPVVVEPKLEEKPEVKDAELAEISEFEAKKTQIQNRLIGLIDTHCDSATRIIEDVESDRKKCDDVYNILFAKMQANDYRASDAMAIVTTLQTKADITKTRANMMDSVAKLLGALKNNNTINPDGGGSGDLSQEDIKKLLAKSDGL